MTNSKRRTGEVFRLFVESREVLPNLTSCWISWSSESQGTSSTVKQKQVKSKNFIKKTSLRTYAFIHRMVHRKRMTFCSKNTMKMQGKTKTVSSLSKAKTWRMTHRESKIRKSEQLYPLLMIDSVFKRIGDTQAFEPFVVCDTIDCYYNLLFCH